MSNALQKLERAEAVIDLLRVNLANDFAAGLESNAGLTLIEAKQDSGVAAAELAIDLIGDARRELTVILADRALDGAVPADLHRWIRDAVTEA
jgi:hypothetical protein